MRKIFFTPVLLAGVAFLLADTTTTAVPKKKAATSKKAVTKTTVTKAPAKKKSSPAKTAVKKTTPNWRTSQRTPTPDRYKEIQQALADKGYFRGTPDGAWNGESVDALKRFQKDQNLDPDGKIGSLSLMALGLGPKRGVAQAASEPAAPPPVAQPRN